jgi:hypothetical protein
MFHGTYDRAAREDRYRKVAAEYTGLSEATPTNFFARNTFASPRRIWSRSIAKCGHRSERCWLGRRLGGVGCGREQRAKRAIAMVQTRGPPTAIGFPETSKWR